jgi:kumamolisin
MICRCSIALFFLFAIPAAARDNAAVDDHMMGLSAAARMVGAPPADQPIEIVVGLRWRDPVALDQLVRDLADPQSASYGHFLSPRAFRNRFAPRASAVVAVTRFLHAAGMRVSGVSRSRLLISAVGGRAAVERAVAAQLTDVLDDGARHTVTSNRPTLPAELQAEVVAIGSGLTLHTAQEADRGPLNLPLQPVSVAQLYGFDGLYRAGIAGDASRGSTIAIATASTFDSDDLLGFWGGMGIGRTADSVEMIRISGPVGASAPDQLETTLDVEWTTAMAPGARVLVYAGTDASAATFLKIYDRIVSENRAAVLTTSWGRCEGDYPSSYLAQMDAILARAAAQGITVLSASGDQGAFACPGDDAPSVSFPASHPYVLAIGGTSLTGGDSVREAAWADGGAGLSTRYPAPAWQMTADPMRALADVALNADPDSGYATYYAGGWAMFGGTSVSAPIWASLIALSNQARALQGHPVLGLAAPALCEVALAANLDAPGFLDIMAGANSAYAAGPGYDYPTGWGVPHAADLVQALSQWAPPADGRGGVATMGSIAPASPDVAGSARFRFQRRCLSTSLEVQVRRFAAGTYTLTVDGSAVASFSPDGRGAAMVELSHVDLRGHRIGIAAADGEELFGTTVTGGGAPVP